MHGGGLNPKIKNKIKKHAHHCNSKIFTKPTKKPNFVITAKKYETYNVTLPSVGVHWPQTEGPSAIHWYTSSISYHMTNSKRTQEKTVT
jgi:hypothetical protein